MAPAGNGPFDESLLIVQNQSPVVLVAELEPVSADAGHGNSSGVSLPFGYVYPKYPLIVEKKQGFQGEHSTLTTRSRHMTGERDLHSPGRGIRSTRLRLAGCGPRADR
jgi:hypothetical protein